MKAIIKGLRYDTATATELACAESHHNRGDFHWWCERLYKTARGAYFLAGEGGPLSHWSQPAGSNGSASGEGIRPLDQVEARHWCEDNKMVDVLESEFGGDIKDA